MSSEEEGEVSESQIPNREGDFATESHGNIPENDGLRADEMIVTTPPHHKEHTEVGNSVQVEISNENSNVCFTLPQSAAFGESNTARNHFLIFRPSDPSAAPLHTAPSVSNKEEVRRPRAAWGQGLTMLSNQSHSKKSQPKEDPIVASDAVAPDIIAPDIIASDSFVPTKETPIEASDLVPESVCSEPVETVADTVASLEDATGAHDHLPVTSTVGEIPSEKDSEETSSQTNVDSDSSDTLVLADNVGTENVCAPPDQADQCISSSHLEQRMGNIAGRTSGRGSGRGRGRAPSRERRLHQLQPISSNRTISAPSNPKMDKELPWRMGSVFSKKEDILRAYNAVVYMVELQKSIPPSDGATCNTDRIIRLHNALQEIKSACDASKLLMPKSNEICASIDLLNDTADDYALLLKNYREKQYLLELKLKELVNDNLDSFPGNIWTGESVASVALADIHHHNKLRALEAHFFHTIMGNMLQTPEEHKDSSRSLELLCDRSLPSISIAAEKCLETQENSTAEPKCVQVDDIATAMQRIRRGVSCVIRDRKLSKDRAWHNHGDNYLGTMHKWKAHIRDIEAKAEELYHHGPQLRGSNSNPHSTRVFQSAMLGDRRADVESKPVTSIGRPESEVQYSAVRSDYEQDKIVHELWSSEWRQLKIERGLVRVPTMKSPWPFADASRQAIAPNWPSDVREISMIVADPAPVKTSPPLVLHDTNDLIDFSGSRLTTDGKRQLCSSLELGVQCSANCNCAYQVEKLRSTERIWSDMEKCIFVDKFLQFPKNFYRISTFLPNRSVKDCVKFYYDAKYSLEFKQLLKEYDNRRRQVKANWQLSLRAAHFTGGAVYPTNEHESKDFLVQTPLDDLYFKTFSCQPLYSPKLLAVPISIDFLKSCIDGEDGKYQLTQQYPRLQVLRESLRRRMGAALGFDAVQEFGAAASLQKPRKRRFDGDDEYDADIGELIEFSGRIDESQRSSPVLSCEPFGSGYQYSCSAWCLTNVLSSMYSYPRAESRPIPRTFTSELLELDQNQRRGNMEKLTLSFDSNSSGHDHLHHDNSHGGRFGGGRGRGGRSYSNSQNVNRHSVTAGLSPALDNAQRAPGGRGRGRGRARIGAAGVGLGRGRGGRGRLATNSDGSSTAVSSSHAETQG